MQTATDSGPLFAVGLSRSGTKLLRDPLNQHPNIRIPTRESYFIPEVLRRYGRGGQLPDTTSRQQFLTYFRQTAFCRNMAALGQPISEAELLRLVQEES